MKLYKREFTITLYAENPEEVPDKIQLFDAIEGAFGCCKTLEMTLTEHKWANNVDDDGLCVDEIESLCGTEVNDND